MTKALILFLLLLANKPAWSQEHYQGLQVDVKRQGGIYTLIASFDTTLTRCAAYRYLTDYEAAKNLPGVIASVAYRESANKVRVDRTANEHVLFFDVRLRSVMEYTEKPFDGIEFLQLAGDSKMFQGSWHIKPRQEGSTLTFNGLWEPDSLIPLFIIDHFAKYGLIEKFNAIAQLAEKRKGMLSTSCGD